MPRAQMLVQSMRSGPLRITELNYHPNLNARSLAAEFGFEYQRMPEASVKAFLTPAESVRILEVETTQAECKIQFEAFKNLIGKKYGN